MTAEAVDVTRLSRDIARALRDAFGRTPVENVSVMPGGLSGATLLALTVGGADYVLRRANPARPAHSIRSPREIACMKIASDRGVAPKLRHVDEEASITIMDRIASAPSSNRAQRLEPIARAVRRLHDGPAFPKSAGLVAMIRQLDDGLRAGGLEGLPPRLVATLNEVTEVTRRFAEASPCHNDLNPGNILETEDAVYFVDWETACAFDPFFDLAQLGVFLFPRPDERAALLDAYLGRRPTDGEKARATLARVMALGFYTAGFFHVMAQSGGPARLGAPLPMHDLLMSLGAGDRAKPDVASGSLFAEMRREAESDAYASAKRELG